jgi:hypothetical protein
MNIRTNDSSVRSHRDPCHRPGRTTLTHFGWNEESVSDTETSEGAPAVGGEEAMRPGTDDAPPVNGADIEHLLLPLVEPAQDAPMPSEAGLDGIVLSAREIKV